MSDWEKRYLGWEHFPIGLDETEIAVFFALGEGDLAAVQAHRRALLQKPGGWSIWGGRLDAERS